MFRIKKQLNEIGVLGINRRNAEFTLRYNQRRFYPLVDDKLQTKKIALKAGIAVPELYGVVTTEYQVRHVEPVRGLHSTWFRIDLEDTAPPIAYLQVCSLDCRGMRSADTRRVELHKR